MATSNRWRFNFTAVNGGTAITVAEIEMRGTVGGADLCNGGTATASSTFNSSFVAANAFDNNNTTKWGGAVNAIPATIEYAFTSAVSIAQYTIQCSNVGTTEVPTAWQFQYWDGAAWVTADTRTGQGGWSLNQIKTYELPVAASAGRQQVFVCT